jgi:hypothetical protein
MTVETSRPELKDADLEKTGGETLKGLSFRTRVAVLWVAVAVALTGSFLLILYAPGAVEEILGGEIEGEPLTEGMSFLMAMFLIIPLAMVAISLLIGDRVNRYVNLIVGLGYSLFGSFLVISAIADSHFNGHVLMNVVACLLGFLIAALSWIGIRQSTDSFGRT